MTITPTEPPHPTPLQDAEPPRRGKPWNEDDFLELMRACRGGSTLAEIARRVGRSESSIGPQLRRLLPTEERHLPVELALPRLRQLDRDGDYDWLSALAQRSKSPWEIEREALAERDARGIGTFNDEELLTVALALASCSLPLQTTVTQRCAQELDRRRLTDELHRRAARLTQAAAERLFGRDRYRDDYQPYWQVEEHPSIVDAQGWLARGGQSPQYGGE
ncbi:hypothetical protein [Agrococcus beijingensis]|uniref:hypothetical protein n=1 Tax=Agrococcus beijingensis TaxID=3068634 RepID=UPI0027424FBD|nr:hypothetical protein [Agrococcus sp. REN33]